MLNSTRQLVSGGRTLKYLLILDFEATCGDTIPHHTQEIIEFPTLLYNVQEAQVQATFQNYVQPIRNPVLTEFCTSLTGITQDVVDNADAFSTVWSRFNRFLKSHGVFEDPSSYAFLTCGDWDLRTMLPKQLANEPGVTSNVTPADAIFAQWINIKYAFRKHYNNRYNNGMTGMLSRLQMPLEGRHHSGIDDCRNIAKIVQRMQQDGWKPDNAVLSSL